MMNNTGADYFGGIRIIPDDGEKRLIRRRYNMIGAVILLNIIIFNGLGALINFLGGTGGNGSQGFINNQIILMLLSVAVPVSSEITAIITGSKLMKIDYKKLFNSKGYNGATVVKLCVMSSGLQMAAGLIALIIGVIFSLFNGRIESPDLSLNKSSFAATVIFYSYACILGPVLEELLYRGMLLQSLRKYNEKFAIFVSALIFGLMHQNYSQFILGFLVGIPLAAVTLKSGSIVPAIIAHIFLNTTGILSLVLMEYSAPEFLASGGAAASLDLTDYGSYMPIMIIGLLRIALSIAGLVIGIIELSRKKNSVRTPTPAGKSRGLPIFSTSVCWIVIFAVYIFLSFVSPFI